MVVIGGKLKVRSKNSIQFLISYPLVPNISQSDVIWRRKTQFCKSLSRPSASFQLMGPRAQSNEVGTDFHKPTDIRRNCLSDDTSRICLLFNCFCSSNVVDRAKSPFITVWFFVNNFACIWARAMNYTSLCFSCQDESNDIHVDLKRSIWKFDLRSRSCRVKIG